MQEFSRGQGLGDKAGQDMAAYGMVPGGDGGVQVGGPREASIVVNEEQQVAYRIQHASWKQKQDHHGQYRTW